MFILLRTDRQPRSTSAPHQPHAAAHMLIVTHNFTTSRIPSPSAAFSSNISQCVLDTVDADSTLGQVYLHVQVTSCLLLECLHSCYSGSNLTLTPPPIDAQVSNTEAIAFYEKFGFKITETIQGAARNRSCAHHFNLFTRQVTTKG